LLAGPAARFFLQRALHAEIPSGLGVDFHLRLPLAAVGAPVAAYFPDVAERLHCELLIPQQAAVANAIGAASGSVLQMVEVLIEPVYSVAGISGYTVHTPRERREFADLEAALVHARAVGAPMAQEAARRAGADDVVVQEERIDQSGSVAGTSDSLYLGSRLRFTAAARPRMATQEEF